MPAINTNGNPSTKMSKAEFIASFLPDSYKSVQFVQLDLDSTDLGIADILRNVNRSFPVNGRERNKIASKEKCVAILAKSDLLEPVSGILLLIVGDGSEIELVSKGYIVLSISEDRIQTDEGIEFVIEAFTNYFIKGYKNQIPSYKEFYAKFIFDEEIELDD